VANGCEMVKCAVEATEVECATVMVQKQTWPPNLKLLRTKKRDESEVKAVLTQPNE
jgi:hypothetical protein